MRKNEEKIKGKTINEAEIKKDLRKPRMANLELLRCIAMMMVVTLHFLGKGELLGNLTQEQMSPSGAAAWALEALSIVSVNVYMLISGYFLCTSSFKPSRLLQLWLQVWFYSVGVALVVFLTGIWPASDVNTFYILLFLFPISMGHYWFLTAYVYLYLLLPIIGVGLAKMSKKQMQLTLGFLLFTFSLLKSVLPIRLDGDAKGYDCIWYLCVFVAAAYIRRFGLPFLEKWWKALLLYVGAAAAVLLEIFGMRQAFLHTGRFGHILNISTEYNHILTFLASVGLFCLFLRVKVSGKAAAIVIKIAPYTLGVYLLHENMWVRYQWQEWLGAARVNSVVSLLLYTLFAVVCVFTCGILIDMARVLLMKGLGFCMKKIPVGRKIVAFIEKADAIFAKKAE